MQLEGTAVVDPDPQLVVDVMVGVAWRMSGQPLNDDARPAVAVRASEEDRVAIRCRPYATFAQPPRNLERNGGQRAPASQPAGLIDHRLGRLRSDLAGYRCRHLTGQRPGSAWIRPERTACRKDW